MAQTLEARLTSKIVATYSNAGDLSFPSESFMLTVAKALTDGTGLLKAQVLASDQRTLSTGTPTEDLDLKAFPCAYGTAAFTKIKAILISVVTTTTGATLTVAPGAANGLEALFGALGDADESILTLQANGSILLVTGDTGYVVDATHKILKMTTAATTLTYNIVIIGEGTVS
jgi:hypothetical protein